MTQSMEDATAQRLRERMVRMQIEARGIRHPLVLTAMRRVPRHRFVAPHLVRDAYEDHPLPIGYGQTISQPYMVARMLELLDPGPGMSVLDIGLGSGYQAALLAYLGARVYGVERHRPLADRAQRILNELGMTNARVACFDGTMGWPQWAPFDRIVVGAGSPDIPSPLVEQLGPEGRLVIPVGTKFAQTLVVVSKRGGTIERRRDLPCRFVDLVGQHGWPEQ